MRHQATTVELPELRPDTPPEERDRRQRRRVRQQEMCRQKKISEIETAMHRLELVDHPDVTFSNKIIDAYDNINDICFNGRLPPGKDTIHWSPTPYRNAGGCMYGVHGVVVGIVLNVSITSLPEMISVVVHEMVHADVEIRRLPIGMQSHGRHFKDGVKRAVEALQGQLDVLHNIVGTEITLDAKTVGKSRSVSTYRRSEGITDGLPD